MSLKISFRPIVSTDMPFLRRLYATTRAEELKLVDWDDIQKQAFLEHQFQAQHTYYQDQYPEGAFELITCEGKPIGRRYINRDKQEFRLIELSILPEFQGRGIGRQLLNELKEEARQLGQPIRHHVERANERAIKLYRELGFEIIEDRGIHFFMEWSPSKTTSIPQAQNCDLTKSG